MATVTSIEWTRGDDGTPGRTWNPLRGCSRKSPGCENCYAELIAARFSGTGLPFEGFARRRSNGEPQWTGKVEIVEEHLNDPFRWRRPSRVFVNSMSDLFHENLSDADIDRVFAVMQASPMHTFQVLTKRADRMREYVRSAELRVSQQCERIADENEWCHANEGATWPLKNVWLGVSVENQKFANERIPFLLETPAAIRFLSCEPLLGPVNLKQIMVPGQHFTSCWNSLTGTRGTGGGHYQGPKLDWVISGGESGPNARPMHPDWARALRDQCHDAGVAYFFKQWGAWRAKIDRDVDDPDWRAGYTAFADKPKRYATLNLAGGCGFHGDRVHIMERVGKLKAGALLDGREWREFPHAS